SISPLIAGCVCASGASLISGTASKISSNRFSEAVPLIKDAPEAHTQPAIKGEIEFRDLTFAYNGKPVLRDINLKIEAGNTVAFVGKTGSGKSTLISLIPRLMNAPDNSILIDGVPLKQYPLAQLRKSIGFVPQETFLFSDTLAENIAFGVEKEELQVADSRFQIPDSESRNDGSGGEKSGIWNLESEIKKSAAIAGLAEDIEDFPYKYQQMVGERGITLSGGQKQRTAIARAVMRDPRILILDDSLSAVDTYTEEKILGGLRDVRATRTTLIVSHRISTVRDADLICVLDDGRIIERGTHDELIAAGGEYADLYERQLLEEELAATD
ncbi:MAG: ATP-binding cassette domain-containing protein, partial [Acidobacteriota bacterium]|nr:ATP-binding cassette domain-containing protein [Acidobacteriota bacterium]